MTCPEAQNREFWGHCMVSLCAKTYCVDNWELEKAKFSCKGLSKSQFVNPIDIYKNVLKTQQPGSGLNKGFRARDNTMYTYEQTRTGFSYFYCKRQMENSEESKPLDITLKPWSVK